MQNKEELLERLNKIKPIVVILLLPPLFALLFSFTFGQPYINDIPVIVYDRDNSETSRQIIEQLDASQGIAVSGYAASMQEVKEKMLSEEAIGALILPENFGADVRKGKNPGARMLMNGTNLFLGNNCLLSATTVFSTLNIGLRVQTLEAGGIVPIDAAHYGTTLLFTEKMMYNPEMSYMQYLIVGIMAVVTQQIFFMFSGAFFMDNRSKQRKLREIVPDICLYMLLSLCGFVMAMIVLRAAVGFRMIGSILWALLVQVCFLLAITGSSLTLSSLFKSKERFAQFSLLLAVPTFITATFVWPAYMMPKGMIVVIKLLWPLCNFAPVVKGVLQKGMGFTDILPSLLQLLIFALAWGTMGYFLYNRKRKGEDLRCTES